jgi:hypothetical protein
MKYLLSILLLLQSQLFAQNNSGIIKTAEYFDDNHKRRDIFYDSDLNIKKEIYYNKDSRDNDYIYAIIEYSNTNKRKIIQRYNHLNELLLSVDFENGTYENYEMNTFLEFKNEYIFDGLQRGNRIIVNYKDGKREGRLLQTDSAISGYETLSKYEVDTRYLKFDILRYYNKPYSSPKFKLFNGIEFNFKDDFLEGIQKGFYPNSEVKFEALYKDFKLISYNSFNLDKSIISKINTKDGFTTNRQIINGTVNSDSTFRFFYLKRFLNAGKIVLHNYSSNVHDFKKYHEFEINSKKFKPDLKRVFDLNKRRFSNSVQMVEASNNFYWIFGVPIFKITNFNLNITDDNLINPIEFKNYDPIYNTPILGTINLYKYTSELTHESSSFIYSPLVNVDRDYGFLRPGGSGDNYYNADFYEDTLVKYYLSRVYNISDSTIKNGIQYSTELKNKKMTEILIGSKWITKKNYSDPSIWLFEKDGSFTCYKTDDLNKKDDIVVIKGKWSLSEYNVDLFPFDNMKYHYITINRGISITHSTQDELLVNDGSKLVKYVN